MVQRQLHVNMLVMLQVLHIIFNQSILPMVRVNPLKLCLPELGSDFHQSFFSGKSFIQVGPCRW